MRVSNSKALPVADTAMVGGKLVLNGAGVRKRGYFKADVTALYMPKSAPTQMRSSSWTVLGVFS